MGRKRIRESFRFVVVVVVVLLLLLLLLLLFLLLVQNTRHFNYHE